MAKYIGIYVPHGQHSAAHVVPGDTIEQIEQVLHGRLAMHPFDPDRPGTLGIWRGHAEPGTDDANLVLGWKAIVDAAPVREACDGRG